jgi:hypothetical protein
MLQSAPARQMEIFMRPFTATLTAVATAAMVAMTAGTADAACKKMGFLVNDYGKEGPTKDAQELLDKHVAEWAAQNGIKNYTIGKKDVTCELYLDLIVFDEHTCTASANVCWDEPGKEKPAKSTKAKDASSAKTAETDKKPKEKKAASTDSAAAKDAAKPAEAEGTADIETGTVGTIEPIPAAPAASDDAAARAAAAAERAAEAAERAAAAAEKAAAASKEGVPSQLEMPGFGAGQPADAAPAPLVDPKS